MSSPLIRTLIFAGGTTLLGTLAQAQPANSSFSDIVSSGSASLSMRLRHEMVEQDNALDDAEATTLRTRVTLRTGNYYGFSGILELDNVAAVGSDHYDSFVTDKYRGNYSVIADPVGSEVNQALIGYRIDEEHNVVFGRQRILHANQRFVGGVGWRQNEQTYDAASYQYRTPRLDAEYSYVWNVNRIFGSSKSSVQLTDFDSESHIATATFKNDWGNIGAYAYALDFEDALALSTATFGLSYAGTVGPIALNASIARQSDYGDNPASYDANYLALNGAYTAGPVRLVLGYELLGSDDGIAGFVTPLATLHAFQGWADMFLATPAGGIDDKYVTVSGKISDLSLSATYHMFESDDGSIDYGSEWDLVAGYPINSNINLELKYATYDEDGFAVDTDKLWFSVNMAF